MPLYRKLEALKLARSSYKGDALGVVPTMGALHQGHLSLIAKAKARKRSGLGNYFCQPYTI
jgi:pantoate--beta-alanine ligase